MPCSYSYHDGLYLDLDTIHKDQELLDEVIRLLNKKSIYLCEEFKEERIIIKSRTDNIANWVPFLGNHTTSTLCAAIERLKEENISLSPKLEEWDEKHTHHDKRRLSWHLDKFLEPFDAKEKVLIKEIIKEK